MRSWSWRKTADQKFWKKYLRFFFFENKSGTSDLLDWLPRRKRINKKWVHLYFYKKKIFLKLFLLNYIRERIIEALFVSFKLIVIFRLLVGPSFKSFSYVWGPKCKKKKSENIVWFIKTFRLLLTCDVKKDLTSKFWTHLRPSNRLFWLISFNQLRRTKSYRLSQNFHCKII